jgi:predicted ATPase/transcriptional regulator with XRE-family HTH domain
MAQKHLPNELLFMYRQRSGLTQSQLADRLGLKSDRMVQIWEGGYSLPPAARLQKLLSVYLREGVFLSGHEQQEAGELWTRVKEMFDTNSSNFETYPVFDEQAFEALRQTLARSNPGPDLNPYLSGQTILSYGQADTYWRGNLPTPLDSFIGREKEVARVGRIIRQPGTRLLTLVGPGGTGKTRLALQAAAPLKGEFAAGIWLVELAGLNAPALVIPTIARELGLNETANQPVVHALTNFLRGKTLLLLLDNFEHLLPAAPALVKLLEASPGVKALVTSRTLLQVRGEQEFEVPPLTLPDLLRLPSLDSLAQGEAVRLFLDRVQTIKPDFQLTNENAMAVAGICQRLDGLPLAIELAAARVRLLTPMTLYARLETRLKLLTDGPADLPPRQQTLRNTIAWSYDLLNEQERVLFARLAVFADGFILEAAEAVGNPEGNPAIDVLNCLQSLISKSLVRPVEYSRLSATPTEDDHFLILETIREYGLEQLAARGEDGSARLSHAHYFLGLAEQAEPQLRGQGQLSWLDRLDLEHNNLRAALAWSLVNSPLGAARLAASLWWFWILRGYLAEGRGWMAEVLSSNKEVLPEPLFSNLLTGAGSLAHFMTDYEQASALLEESLSLVGREQDRWGDTFRLGILGVALVYLGHSKAGASLLEKSLVLARKKSAKWNLAFTLYVLAISSYSDADYTKTESLANECYALVLQIGDKWLLQYILLILGHVNFKKDEYAKAIALYADSLALACIMGTKQAIAVSLEGLAWANSRLGLFERSARIMGASAGIRESFSCPLPPFLDDNHDLAWQEGHAKLGPARFTELYQQGFGWRVEQAMAYGLGELEL